MSVPSYEEAVSHLAKAFRAGIPLRIALDNTAERYGSMAWDTPESQKRLLSETMLYTHHTPCASQFSFGTARCGRFMRLLMEEIDHVRDADMDETFAKYAAASCQSNSSLDEDFSYVVFEVPTIDDIRPFRDVIIRVSRLFNDLGHRVWEGGLCLYAEVVDMRSDIRTYFAGRRVLEFGAGTGLSAAAYADSGVEYALLTDYEDSIVSNMEHNISLNVTENDSIETCVLDAMDCAEVLHVANSKKIDTVVAADMTYDEDLLVGLVKSFEDVVTEDRVGLLVVTERNEKSVALLIRCLGESGLDFETISCRKFNETFDYLVGWDFCRVKVFRVWRESLRVPFEG